MKKKDRDRLQQMIQSLCDLKKEIYELKKTEEIAADKARNMETRSILRGNEIDMGDAIGHLFKGIGKLNRIRITI